MDGGDSAAGHYRFNDSLARKGYKVLVISKDGFAAELESSLIARNDEIILAYKKNGKYLSESDGPLATGRRRPAFKEAPGEAGC